LQIPLRTESSVEAYIANREWREARLPACPVHPSGGCSFARHGTYARVTPHGLRVARWYCPEGHRTFSLLPDFLAARLPGLLASIDDILTAAAWAKSTEAAADALRGSDVTLPSGVRWLRRRVRAVQAALDAMAPMGCEAPTRARAWCSALQTDRDHGRVLLGLRRSLSPQALGNLPPPLGFGSRRGLGRSHVTQRHRAPRLAARGQVLQRAGIAPARAKPWKPSPGLLAFLQSL